MYCRKCGNELDDNALFCSKCGEKSSVEEERNVVVSNESYEATIGEKLLRLINIVVIALNFLVGIVQLLLSNILGGIVVLLVTILLVTFVFRKKQIDKIKAKFKNAGLRRIIITAIYLLLPIVMFAGIGIGASFEDGGNTSNPDAVALSYARTYAETTLKDNLKNPESLQIHSVEIYVDFEYGDYHYYSITIDYSAQNGFGGYNRNDDYDILVKVSKETNKAYKASTEEYLEAITNYNNSNN